MREKSAAAVCVLLTLWRVCPWRSFLHSWSLLWLSTHRGTKVTGESEMTRKMEKVSTFWVSAQLKALCTFPSTLAASLPVCGSMSEVAVLNLAGGWGRGSCNIRVLFVRFLFLMFLSFCTIIPFFILCVFSSFWHLLFTVKMCPSVSPRWETGAWTLQSLV